MKTRRRLSLLILPLIPLLAAYRWAAKQLPLSDFDVIRTATWLNAPDFVFNIPKGTGISRNREAIDTP